MLQRFIIIMLQLLFLGSLMLDASGTLQAAPGPLQAAPGRSRPGFRISHAPVQTVRRSRDTPGLLQAAPGPLQGAPGRSGGHCSWIIVPQ